MNSNLISHRTYGAVPVAPGETQFRVWAPQAKKLLVEFVARTGDQEDLIASHPLRRNADGLFTGIIKDCPVGTLYRFKLDDKMGRPDPRSRFQPFGVHGPSQVIDLDSYEWSDKNWSGVQKRDLVIYEMHVGSFTQEGTYLAAIERLGELKQLGITAIEVLPLSQTPGRWNWGYDGVNYFAPRNNFGTPDELKAFVDACHENSIAVINDVVYNHVGPEGNYLSEFGGYRSKKYGTPWGDALDFDVDEVRKFVVDNVLFWMDEYHFDGLRLDAVHYMFDDKAPHILQEIKEQFERYSETIDRKVYLIGESNIYDPELVGDVENGNPNYDAIWSDCLMHAVYSVGDPEVRLTNRSYTGSGDLAKALEHAYVFSTPEAVRVTDAIRKQNHPNGDRNYIESLIMALQTHDSVGNHPHGKRLHQLTSHAFQLAAAPLFLLYPSIPMIFMGEEWSTDAPFPFFADFEDQRLRKSVDKGRRDEYPHHDWAGSPLPSDPAAFLETKSTPAIQNSATYQWYKTLLDFRKQGIAGGWLSVANMRTESDTANNVYRLVYSIPKSFANGDGKLAGRELHVCARLDAETSKPISFGGLGVGEILFDSRSGEGGSGENGSTTLEGQHGLIWLA
ncbi:MAG: alpha-amylase family glycosyl hydrolase [Mariniblastus sp.]